MEIGNYIVYAENLKDWVKRIREYPLTERQQDLIDKIEKEIKRAGRMSAKGNNG